ncbi:hypothetical protein PG984_006950 [Apiospora sp. TS-2023a]
MDSKKQFVCTFVKPNGRTCDQQFTRAWNLQRHIQKQHAREARVGNAPPSVAALPTSAPHKNSPPALPVSVNVGQFHAQFPAQSSPPRSPIAPNLLYDVLSPADADPPPGGPDIRNLVGRTRSGEEATHPTELPVVCQDVRHSSDGDNGDDARRGRHTPWRGRSRVLERFPSYDVRTSRKYPLQEKAISWLTHSAYEHFHEYWERILNSWGVRAGHLSTCVLVPADWVALDPAELVPKFNQRTCPRARMDRPCFSYEDHQTSISRAVAWFSKWPRSGGELDVFLGCGPFKSMHGSHTCHHENCIVHICYEPSDMNIDRIDCHDRARFLRSEARAIPERCDIHDPPCLLQLASLTTFEAYLIQFAVLCRSRRLSRPPAPSRPRRHPYKTFETELPLSAGFGGGSSLRYDDEPLAGYDVRVGRPTLLCRFCPGIKSFSRVTPLWSHLVYAHDDVNTADRLKEISWSASLWREYWQKVSDGGRRDGLTMQRLAQAVADGFTWKHVLDWGLR